MVRFFLIFIVVLAVLFRIDMLDEVQRVAIEPWTSLLATASAALMTPLDADVAHHGRILMSKATGFAVSIEAGCNGVEAAIILIAGMIAFPSSWKHKLAGIAIGIAAVQAVNLLRIISLYYLGKWNMTVFEFAHLYLWQALIMLDVLVVWMLWIRWIARQQPPSPPQPPSPMQLSSVGRFLLVAIGSLLCLMPLWYYLSPQLSKPVFFMAGEASSAVFHWALSYTQKETTGVLNTTLKVVSVQNGQFRSGKLAPVVDYRLLGYGIVILWALLLASFPRGWVRKLLIGSVAMLPIQAVNVALQWCNDAFNRAGREVFVQTGLPGWVADVVAFLYHFNLFIFTALAPVMLWLLLDREFLAKLHAQARAAAAVQQPPQPQQPQQPE